MRCRELPANAAEMGAMTTTNKLLCDKECLAKLEGLQTQETKTGLKYKDIVVGTGPTPPTGYQVRWHDRGSGCAVSTSLSLLQVLA